MDLQTALQRLSQLPTTAPMPTLFVGHGSPMHAIDDNAYTQAWQSIGEHLPRPQAILSISAHWLTRSGIRVAATESPRTIHDFGGFPQALYEQQYPAPGSPGFAEQTVALLQRSHAQLDQDYGLDHGTWCVLKKMYPLAEIPTYQLSLDYSQLPQWHRQLAEALAPLRERGVLILGSGNIVHNLGALAPGRPAFDWALEFDQYVTDKLIKQDVDAVTDFLSLGALARQAHPTHDHYLPLIYIAALRKNNEELSFFNADFDLGSVSMRSFLTVPTP